MRGIDGNWVHIGNGALRMRHVSGNQMEIFFCWNNNVCDTRVFFSWSGCHMDIYVLGRWQFSTGSSMDGLCGNYNANAGDDVAFLNAWANYKVDGTPKSFFANRAFRQIDNLDEHAMTEEELDETEGLSRLENALPMPKGRFVNRGAQTTSVRKATGEDLQILSQAKLQVREEACNATCGQVGFFAFLHGDVMLFLAVPPRLEHVQGLLLRRFGGHEQGRCEEHLRGGECHG